MQTEFKPVIQTGNAQPERTDSLQNSQDFCQDYEILEILGEGGMGIVYKVRHKKNDSQILAMKVLKSELSSDAVSVKRFQQELKTTGLLTHPNIVPIYDSGMTSDGRPFFIMEYIDGPTLEQVLMEEGFVDVDRLLQLSVQLCEALSHAHEKRIVHRDLKPGNIMLSGTSDLEMLKVLDFGIARVFQKASRDAMTKMTQLGEVVGSPVYMSPEQCLSQRLDERSDIYSFGVIMYEALVGSLPFSGLSPVEIIMGHLQASPPDMRKVRPDFNIPPELESLILSCLEKEANLRPASFKEIAIELQKIGTSRKNKNAFKKLGQIPIRIANKAGRFFRRGYKNHTRTFRNIAAISVLGVAAFTGVFYFNQHTCEQYINDAGLALSQGNYDEVALQWKNAIDTATRNHETPDAIAVLNERAADDLGTNFNRYFDIDGNHWDPVLPERSSGREQTAYRARLAHPFLQKALTRASSQRDRLRLLDKLISVASALNLQDEEIQYLIERIKITPVYPNTEDSPIIRLAQLRMNRGEGTEAETLLKKAVKAQEVSNNRPYPTALTVLAELYRHEEKLDKEEAVRRRIVEEVRSHVIKNEGYEYQLKQELQQLAECLRRSGKLAEATALNAEAARIKT